MTYCYDLLGNFNESILKFYEWEKDDDIVNIKKIPLIKVSKEDMHTLLTSKISLDKEFLINYQDKCLIKNAKCSNIILLFTSSSDSIMIEFSPSGKSIYYSSLLIEDELEITEIAYNVHTTKLPMQVLDKLKYNVDYRQSLKAKNIIMHELKKIEKSNNTFEALYYYYEWFLESTDDYNKAIKRMFKEILKPFNKDMERVEKLIRLSYKEKL